LYGDMNADNDSATQVTAPSTPLAQQWDGYGTGLKPAFEPIVVAMKPNEAGYADNARKWGVAGFNIDGGRVGSETREQLEAGFIRNGRTDEEIFSTGYGRPKDKIGKVTGRFPANVIHDGSDEVEAEFDKAGVSVSSDRPRKQERMTSKGVKGGAFGNPLKVNHNGYNGYTQGFSDTGSASRFFYTAKASPSERGKHNNHPTVKPLAIMQYLVRLTKTPNDDMVLDPFMGSGTTLVAAQNEGRQAIGIELSEDYCKIAVERLRQPSFFSIPDKVKNNV
jgi:site-specific DNA-methyltransferase (adenine-specific)